MGDNAMVVILMGVTGSGKTTLGRLLAEQLGCEFFDGDDYHPIENIRKMSAGIPLTDQDRVVWLRTLAGLIRKAVGDHRNAVLACSALKQTYREVLEVDQQQVRFVYLKGNAELIHSRVQRRSGHYMKTGMLESQFAALEEPQNVLTIDIRQSPQDCVSSIIAALQF